MRHHALRRRYGHAVTALLGRGDEAAAIAKAREVAASVGQSVYVYDDGARWVIVLHHLEPPYTKVHVDGRAIVHTRSAYAHGPRRRSR
jgi:hypothetical protein